MPEKQLCMTCRFARIVKWTGSGPVLEFECFQRGRGWLMVCPQYEREPGSDDEL
jgi:hypothetical protein